MSDQTAYCSMYPGFYQTAYVTNDLALAMERVGAAYGILTWFSMSGFTFPMATGLDVSIDVALANLGDTQFELIRPAGGDDGLYRDSLSGGSAFELVFHHMCKAFETEEQFLENRDLLKRQGIAMPMDNSELPSNGIARACYGDFRGTLGHYLEYVWFTDAGRDWLREIPRNGQSKIASIAR